MKRSWTVHTHMVTIQQYTSTVIGRFFRYIYVYIYIRADVKEGTFQRCSCHAVKRILC